MINSTLTASKNATVDTFAPYHEYRYLLRCRTETSLRVGSGAESRHTDNDLRRSAKGKVVVPGSSIAGALRGAIERMSGVSTTCKLWISDEPDDREPCLCPVCQLFGDARPVNDSALASKVWVRDATFVGDPDERIIDGVALHRGRRSSADARRFDAAEVVRDQVFWIDIRAGGIKRHERLTLQELAWISAAVRLLDEGYVTLGGHVRRGSGRIKIDQAWLRARDLTDPHQLVATVMSNPWTPPESDSSALWPDDPVWCQRIADDLVAFPGRAESASFRNAWTKLEFDIHPNQELGGTFLVSDPEASYRSGYDRAPRRGADKAELPASSLRGVLRSGCERIIRTMACSIAQNDGLDCQSFACDPTDAPCASAAPCLACRLFGSTDRAGPLTVRVGPGSADTQPAPQDHLAIDRFTGGARDRLKFDALAARGNIQYHVELSLDSVEGTERLWMIGLLMLALGDIHQGKLTIGHGAAKGHGFWQVVPPDAGSIAVNLTDAIEQLWVEIKTLQHSATPVTTKNTSTESEVPS